MRKTFLVVAAIVILTVTMSGCVTVPAERSVKTYNQEHRAANDALSEAKERGAGEDCPARYMAAAWKRNDAVDVFWSCRTAEAIKMMKDAREQAEALCGEPAEKMAEPEPMKPEPVKEDEEKLACDTGEKKAKPAPMKPEPAPMKAEPEPAMAEEGKTWVIEDVNFDFDRADIKPGFRENLDEAAKVMRENPSMRFQIHGHADSLGDGDYNKRLSERRALAVKRYLTDKGIDAGRLTTVGHGESKPVATNDTDEGRARNRRVEIEPVK